MALSIFPHSAFSTKRHSMPRITSPAQGVLELHPRGHGFLRNPVRNYFPQPEDAYVPAGIIQKHRLREGLLLAGPIEHGGPSKGMAPSSDGDAATHARIAEIVVERAKRLAEQGRQVFVLLDSLTRLARAYNKTAGTSGRTMSGGMDSRAMEIPKRLFGCARA